jgi:hypothetical protein
LLLAAGLLFASFVVACSSDTAVVPEGKAAANHALSRSASSSTLVTTAKLNLRQLPSMSATVLRVMASGTVVTSLGESSNGFLHVELSGDDGWALEKFLQPAEDDQAPTPSADFSGSQVGNAPSFDPNEGVPPGGDTGGGATGGDLCVDTINQYRSQAGLPPLQRWTESESCADGEAQSDSSTGRAHGAFPSCGEVAQNECPGFPGQPENALPQCLRTMVDEGPGGGHYQNMFSTEYTRVACGVTMVGGTMWSVQDFR